MRRVGRSGAVAALLAAMVLASIPGTAVPRRATALGLGQNWALFAPDPLRARGELKAEIRYADGTTELWRPPAPRAVAQELGYRWQEWARELVRDDHSELWEPAARWIARTNTRGGQLPVRVTLRRRFALLPPPGGPESRPRWSEFDFYTLDLR